MPVPGPGLGLRVHDEQVRQGQCPRGVCSHGGEHTQCTCGHTTHTWTQRTCGHTTHMWTKHTCGHTQCIRIDTQHTCEHTTHAWTRNAHVDSQHMRGVLRQRAAEPPHTRSISLQSRGLKVYLPLHKAASVAEGGRSPQNPGRWERSPPQWMAPAVTWNRTVEEDPRDVFRASDWCPSLLPVSRLRSQSPDLPSCKGS